MNTTRHLTNSYLFNTLNNPKTFHNYTDVESCNRKTEFSKRTHFECEKCVKISLRSSPFDWRYTNLLSDFNLATNNNRDKTDGHLPYWFVPQVRLVHILGTNGTCRLILGIFDTIEPTFGGWFKYELVENPSNIPSLWVRNFIYILEERFDHGNFGYKFRRTSIIRIMICQKKKTVFSHILFKRKNNETKVEKSKHE